MYKVIFTFSVIISLIRGEDYYEILGINKTAGQDEIRKAFKKLAIIHHPDKNNDDSNAHDKFIQLTIAYEVLKEPGSRQRYDLYGEDGLDMTNKEQTMKYHSWSHYQNSFNMYEDDQHVVILEKHDYFESVTNSDSAWFVNFYSPMCSHCHHLAPVWKKVAKLLDGVTNIAALNCEDNWQLCHQVGIRVYPTLIHFKKNSQHGTHYTGRHIQEAIIRFALDRLNIHVPEINKSQWKLLLHGMEITKRPVLVFICGDRQDCFTFEENLIAAVFDKVIDTKIFICEDGNCHRKISHNTYAVYLPVYNASSWEPVFFDNIPDINALMEKLLDELPGPQELTASDFENIGEMEFNVPWLVCFYLGDSAVIDMQMKKLSAININFGKMNCGRSGQLCNKLGVNRYPIWGVLKPGGAFELHHGKNTNNDITKFVKTSVRATNVWALTAKEILSILQRNSGDEVWFLDWYAPWCPPCIHFLSELRRASLEFDVSIVRFGTIDCTVHTKLCRQYNIHSYPTAMLINGSNTYQFTTEKTATSVIQFINEIRNPSVIKITSENFHRKLAKKTSKVMWIVDYFAPWCGPCQRLAPEWITVAKLLSDLSFINVASVNCEIEISLCASQGVRSYPNIRLYPMGSDGLSTVALYNGQRDSLSILTWITAFFPKKVRDLNPSEYREILNSKHVWIVDFYTPRCGHCQRMEPQFAIAAQLVEKVRFGRINCNFYMHDCVQANIQIFPTLILYKPKHKRNNSYDGIKITGTTARTIRDEILEIINSRLKHDEL